MSYSYPSGPPSSGNIYQRSSSIDYETGAGSFNEPAPTRSTVRNRNNVPQVVSQRNLNGEANHGQGPSFTSEPLNHQPFPDQGKSINEPFKGVSNGYGEKAPSVGAMRQFIASDLSGGNMYPYSDGQPPSLTDVARRDASQTGSSYTSNEGSVPQTGISLTGKNFSKYHPGVEIDGHVGISGASSSSSNSNSISISLNGGEVLSVADLKVYTYLDLKACTKNFKPDMVLGVGGFGTVFKGWVEEKTMLPSKTGCTTGATLVAIKMLNHESVQGFQEWQSEVNFLGRLSHPNLVKLLGYCREDKNLLLVYEFMPKGSLDYHLFRRGSAIQPISWALRLKIAIGAARGLAFIHSLDDNVIYRDIKASNILLDENYNAKISDFGLAKLGPSGGLSHVTTRVMGTYGYAAPEYIAAGHLYVKSDVYGFGVVLLEMMTGLRVLDSRRPGPQQHLVEWAKPLLLNRKKIKTLMDSKIDGQYSSKVAMLFAQLVLHCLEQEPRKRPDMKHVVEVLEQINAMRGKPKLIA